jgi:hypothetical protein
VGAAPGDQEEGGASVNQGMAPTVLVPARGMAASSHPGDHHTAGRDYQVDRVRPDHMGCR